MALYKCMDGRVTVIRYVSQAVMKSLVMVCCIIMAASAYVHAQKTGAFSAEAAASQYLNQTGFVKNAGQFTDENGASVQSILYGAHIGTCGIFITSKGLSYINYRLKSKKSSPVTASRTAYDTIQDYIIDIERTDVTLEHAMVQEANAEMLYDKASRVSYNYYTAANKTGTVGLHAYGEIKFKNVYPFIDWCVQLTEDTAGHQTVKYNFIIRAGGDAGNISLRYSNNAQLRLDKEGGLLAHTSLADFTEKAPVSYVEQSKEPVQFNYHLSGQTLRFTGSRMRPDKTVVLDPEVFWATYLPSTQPDVVNLAVIGADIATDENSNIYVTLSTRGRVPFITLNAGNGAFYQDYAVTLYGAMIVLKFSDGGRLLWSTYFSGKGQTGGNVMAVDKWGNVYAAGRIMYEPVVNYTFKYGDIPLKSNGGYFDTIPKINFITKFDTDGKLLWSSFLGGYDTYPEDMTTDSQGNVYITGWSTSALFPVVNPGNGAYMQSAVATNQLAFINQFSADCRLLWSTAIEGNAYDPYARVEVDIKGNIYLLTSIRSSRYPLKDAGGYFNPNLQGTALVKFNKDRQITWCTGLPDIISELDITTDDDCNVYVATGRGILRKFNEKTELVWTQTYVQTIGYSYKRLVYNRKNKVVHVLGIMNDVTYNFPTKNTACKGSFFFSGRDGKFQNVTGPIFMTYTTEGNLQYCSLADWLPQYFEYSNFSVDGNGDAVYLFKDTRTPDCTASLTDPGGGAYYTSQYNKQAQTPFLIKLKNSELEVASALTSSSSCDSNNTVDLRVLCGMAPFRYEWSNGLSSASVRLQAGKYWVKITDGNFLTKTLYFNIDNPPGTVQRFKAEASNTYCDKKNGLITINGIQGGKSPYSFSLNGQTFTNSGTFTNIDSGKYVLTVKDADGCLAKDTVSVALVAGPSSMASTVTAASCNGDDGAVDIKVTGGTAPYLYAVNNGTFQTDHLFKNLPASTAILSVKDSAGCVLTSSQLIPPSLPPDSAAVTITPDHCLSAIGALEVTKIWGGHTPFAISLDGSSYSSQLHIGNVKAGAYNLYVRDSKNCVLTRKIRIENIPGPDKIYFHVSDATCGSATGEVRVDSISGGVAPLLFSMNSGNFQNSTLFKTVSPGTQLLEVKDKYGCTASHNLTVQYIKQTAINILPHDTLVCYQQQAPYLLTVEDPSAVKTIRWSTGAQSTRTSITPSQNQSVFVTVTDLNGCMIKDTAFTRVKACNTADNCIAIPTAFSPNHDGINDAIGPVVNGCLIKNLDFRVYNRYGQMIFQTHEPGKKWNGRISGVEQPQGAYVFMCSFTTGDNVSRNVKGTFMLIR